MTQALPTPGDIFVVPDETGCWSGRLTFERFHGGQADVGEFTDDTGERVILSLDAVTRPGLVRRDPDPPPPKRRRRRSRGTSSDPHTPAQHRTIFALAQKIGFDVEDVRRLCPRHSISGLTRAEAASVIDALQGRAGDARDTGGWAGEPASANQRNYAADLAAGAGLDAREFARWLRRNYRVDSTGEPSLTKGQANRIIHALQAIKAKRERQVTHG